MTEIRPVGPIHRVCRCGWRTRGSNARDRAVSMKRHLTANPDHREVR
jgi:hypothetical protein